MAKDRRKHWNDTERTDVLRLAAKMHLEQRTGKLQSINQAQRQVLPPERWRNFPTFNRQSKDGKLFIKFLAELVGVEAPAPVITEVVKEVQKVEPAFDQQGTGGHWKREPSTDELVAMLIAKFTKTDETVAAQLTKLNDQMTTVLDSLNRVQEIRLGNQINQSPSKNKKDKAHVVGLHPSQRDKLRGLLNGRLSIDFIDEDKFLRQSTMPQSGGIWVCTKWASHTTSDYAKKHIPKHQLHLVNVGEAKELAMEIRKSVDN